MNEIKKPLVGLLYNPSVPSVLSHAGSLVNYLAVVPERLWFDLGRDAIGGRFRKIDDAIDQMKRCVDGRVVSGHGVGLSLPTETPLDTELLDEIAVLASELNFAWYSEHLTMFLTPHADAQSVQAGLALPIVYDDETFEMLSSKILQVQTKLNCNLLLENGSIFTSIPEMEMTEPRFLNRLYRETGCGVLLDLHNLYVTARHGNVDPEEYLAEIDPAAVVEIHMAGGDELMGFYTDSHSRLASEPLWSWAYEFAPRFTRLRAITFEYHESYFEVLEVGGIAAQLERMHELAEHCTSVLVPDYA
jgi:uncharacterized protein (UPF0276 family)